MYEKTKELRAICDRRGIRYTEGYHDNGTMIDTEMVTTIWPDNKPSHTLCFEEDEWGTLTCEDEMSPAQAIAAAMA